MSEFETRLVVEADKTEWRGLFDGYADSYGVIMTDNIADTVWSWLYDPSHGLEGLIARDGHGTAVDIAHIRSYPRPLGGSEFGFLDHMFVHPGARGSGATDALFAALQIHADSRGWTTIRWITQHFTERGRAFYDRYTGGPSDFIMYQWMQV